MTCYLTQYFPLNAEASLISVASLPCTKTGSQWGSGGTCSAGVEADNWQDWAESLWKLFWVEFFQEQKRIECQQMIWEAIPGSRMRGVGRGEWDRKEAQAECKWAVTGVLRACTELVAQLPT